MSASSKKKLRNAEQAAKLTERQQTEQREAKKLKIYTASFIVAVVALLVIALTVGVMQVVTNSGIRERNSVAMTVNGQEINAVEMSYFYKDYVQSYASDNSYFLAYMLDTTAPLNEQIFDNQTGETWADYFLNIVEENVHSVYAMSQAAEAAGFTLSDEEQMNLDNTFASVQFYSGIYGYSNVDDYIQAMYGPGSDFESYKAYCTRNSLANAYYYAYADSLVYDDATIRAHEGEDANKYNSYTYNSYYMTTASFLQGGTAAEDGSISYSEEEQAAAQTAAAEAAEALTDSTVITNVEALDLAIDALEINKNQDVSSTEYTNVLYSSIDADVAAWLAADRQEGDLGAIPRMSTTDGETEIIGYYIVRFTSVNDNNLALANVRHILVGFEGGTTDETTGITTYSDEEKAAAKEIAEGLLAQWESGDATEESFAALATASSTDTASLENGGLYEDIYPGQMVPAFEQWCFDDHNVGDTGIVETEYGYHVMYYSGESDITYRDLMITNNLKSADVETWYNELLTSATYTSGDHKYLPLDMIIGG